MRRLFGGIGFAPAVAVADIELAWAGNVSTSAATVKVRSSGTPTLLYGTDAELVDPASLSGTEGSDDIWTFNLSGLAGYIVPLGGVIVPIIIWVARKDSPIIVGIAKQALLLNLVVFLMIGVTAVLWITLILIPLVLLFWLALGVVAIVFPVVGAIRSSQGIYYRYPLIGLMPG